MIDVHFFAGVIFEYEGGGGVFGEVESENMDIDEEGDVETVIVEGLPEKFEVAFIDDVGKGALKQIKVFLEKVRGRIVAVIFVDEVESVGGCNDK